MYRVNLLVIGAGVLGLAIARKLASQGKSVVILEREKSFGRGISARNSEVIHAGLYYAPGSLKARLCVDGARSLYRYCAERGIDHRRYGKLVVATEAGDESRLHALFDRAVANGVSGIALLEARAVTALEPGLRASAALSSAETGVLDVQAYMSALARDAEDAGAIFIFGQSVGAIGERAGSPTVILDEGELSVEADWVVNAAGLDAANLAAGEGPVPAVTFVKGSYFQLAGAAPFARLIYPLPEAIGLGTHMTLDLRGTARFGPDSEPVATPDFTVDPARRQFFAESIRRYWPALEIARLSPAYAGVRPVLEGGNAADFLVHRRGRSISLLGFGSPGLTASLAIADHVAAMIAAD